MEQVVITGVGIVCPIGVGAAEVWASVEAGRSGVRVDTMLSEAGWPCPVGGMVTGFEAKKYVKPRKSLKVMADEIQWGFAAGELAVEDAGLEEAELDPDRVGVVCGAGLLYCDQFEMEGAYRAAQNEQQEFEYDRWGSEGMRNLTPLWLLKYLPNMSACHIGIRRDARGPTNTHAHGDASSLLALGEATQVIRRGDADVMFTGGSSKRRYFVDPIWRRSAPIWSQGIDPAKAARPFDADRLAPIVGEGSAILVLESASHAERRGATPIATVDAVATRTEPILNGGSFTGASITAAVEAALQRAGAKVADIGSVNAHGFGGVEEDPIEAAALRATFGDTPVTAPKSYFGNMGAASGAAELVLSLLGMRHGVIPPTLNYETPDPACPVNVVTKPEATDGKLVAVNYNVTGTSVAAVVSSAQS